MNNNLTKLEYFALEIFKTTYQGDHVGMVMDDAIYLAERFIKKIDDSLKRYNTVSISGDNKRRDVKLNELLLLPGLEEKHATSICTLNIGENTETKHDIIERTK